ncbi:RagB/SusD family nutrient uptake outer membrane protein [Cellulophaga baltica]|uniref:RagB/SusD family nutrient uptake outer membrane protein n=1 Tax=Cellulophaga TaxID=104264 RepID=UPI001C071F45|nr:MULTISPECIES: RagB/SusD family nutrient uptake outer membrane protein [Cellulophaga]MBU2995333.1 RagB/SusD family nutrient uptake outer membrane protein [Cellulophaga baltica]MDO6766728.1 RagB/SusD family nutrient uptake outer membrane protein [Cellulophaga sp. 1_MG-2023]
MLHKTHIILLTILTVVLVSCEKEFLETQPTDAIAATDALSSAENMDLLLNGLHRQMYAQNPLPGTTSSRSGQSYYMPSFDVIAGNLIHSSPGNGWMTADLQWLAHTNANTTTVDNLWYERYHFVFTANSIINTVAEGNLTIDADLNNILGQSYAYRAWAYHQLVTTFAKGYLIGSPSTDLGVPLVLDAGVPYTSEARSVVEDVYTQIEEDIDLAIGYFEDASGPDNKSNISIDAAYGIKARIALSKGDWQTAADAAVLARENYPLLDEVDWLSGFNSVDLSEVIWGGTVIDTETNFFQSYFYFIGSTFNGSQTRTNPKIIRSDIYDQIPDTDYRAKAWLPLAPNTNSSASNGQGGSYLTDPNYDNEDDFWDAWEAIITEYGMTTAHNTHPYISMKFLQENPGSIDPDDVIYMRSSEMYLIEAEAKAMLSDISGAQTALSILGEARDSAYDVTLFNTQEALLDEIKFQRRVELWGEGFSYLDQIRWDEGIDQSNSGASEVLYGDGFFQERPSVNDEWIWKIPQAEINANPNIGEAQQN